MLQRAHAAKPDDASIADSLGWALFVNGDTARALPLIERAAEAEPTNAEIANISATSIGRWAAVTKPATRGAPRR